MNKTRWSLPELAAWAGTDVFPGLFQKAVHHPRAGIRPASDLESSQQIGTILSCLPEKEYCLLWSLLLAEALLDSNAGRWQNVFLKSRIDPRQLGLPFSFDEALAWKWTRIPLALVDEQNQTGLIRFALIGLCATEKDPFPAWAGQQMDESARQGVNRAILLHRLPPGSGVFFWPFIDFTSPGMKIKGGSLGLAVYLGIYSLLEDQNTPGLLCSGQLVSSGLKAPEGLALKITEAERMGFKGVLFASSPSFKQYAQSGENRRCIELLPVSDLDTARILWSSYLPGKGQRLIPLIQARKDPQQVAALVHTAPGHLLEYLEEKEQVISRSLQTLISTGNLRSIDLFFQQVQALQNLPDWPRQKLQLLLSPLDWKLIRNLKTISPELAATACRLRQTHCRHLGLIHEALLWEGFIRQEGLQEVSATADGWELEAIMQKAEAIVQVSHNRYRFDPKLPNRHVDETLLDMARKSFAYRKNRNQAAVNRALGAYYGTLCQHYGFCGPRYLEPCLGSAQKAMEAFGNGKNQDYYQDWLRIHSYLVYANLDAGLIQDAKKSLQIYLQTNRLDDVDPFNRNPYEHAAFARFQADTAQTPGPHYMKWALAAAVDLPRQHPWQLWLLNMGWISKDDRLKKEFWTRALTVCNSSGISTLRAMALLPLARLYTNRFQGESFLQAEISAALAVIQDYLCQEHFADLLRAETWQSVLEMVDARPARFFPFSYR
ncbi:MAG: hypothetical protein K9K79_01600 [Desulfohalobiaceae bacterium]|nr:hypothetical protein [Desulfohalobiaceae bacterium]